jgi:hypothetical protein
VKIERVQRASGEVSNPRSGSEVVARLRGLKTNMPPLRGSLNHLVEHPIPE